MDAIVTAGGIPQPRDPLYVYSNGDSKALIDVAGKPMIQWVLDALGDAKQVDNVIVIGLTAKSGITCKKPMYFISNQGRMLANIVVGVNKSLELNRQNQYVLVVSSDIPTLKAEMVDWLVETCMQTQDDLYYGVCPREVMESRFPGSKRTYTHLKGMDVCGADINITHVRMASEHLDTWEALMGNRKSPIRQAGIVGLGTLFAYLFRSDTLNEMAQRISARIGIKGRAIVWDHAEPCMDVDKPHQLELLRADLEAQISSQIESQPVKKRKAPARTSKAATAKKTSTAKPRAKAKSSAK